MEKRANDCNGRPSEAHHERTHQRMSIAAPYVPVIVALICTTKRSMEGVKILDLMGLQKLF